MPVVRDYCHYDTPKKAAVIEICSFLDDYAIPYFKADVFRHKGVSKRRGWQYLSDTQARRHHNQVDDEGERIERRGRKSKVSNWHITEMDRIIREEGFEARKLTWA
jgi:hypothetical protein